MGRIVLVDNDPIRLDIYHNTLLKKGYSLAKTRSIVQGTFLLETGEFKLGIIAQNTISEEPFSKIDLQKYKTRYKDLEIIIIQDKEEDEIMFPEIIHLVNPSLEELVFRAVSSVKGGFPIG